ncbi:MAG: hypothetical protein ACKVTZ_02885, partial [Bacteroidia bacterium]
YEKDLRYLAIGEQVWAMARKGKYWKANVQTTDFVQIEPEKTLKMQVQKLQQHLAADIIAIDVLMEKNGNCFVLEYNDIPGLSGFPVAVRHALAECVRQKK